MVLGHIYAKHRLKKPPSVFYQIANIRQIIAWIPSRLSWTPALRGRYQYLLCPRFPKAFTGTNNQEGPTVFDTSTRYTLWDSVCTQSINTYFYIYTEYRLLGKEDYTEFNDIGGIIKPKGIGAILLDLEDTTVQNHNLNLKQLY